MSLVGTLGSVLYMMVAELGVVGTEGACWSVAFLVTDCYSIYTF